MHACSKRKFVPESQGSLPIPKKAKQADSTPASLEDGTVEETASTPSDSPPSLEELLDLTDIADQTQIQARFDSVAQALLCDYQLVVTAPKGTSTLEIMELEFYVQKEGFHEDPFTHGSEEQKISGRWYFHRAPRKSADANRSLTHTTAWRGGSRKGMDLTIGRSRTRSDDGTLLRGGILLRSARVIGPKGKVVSGPSLLVDEILSLSGASSIGDLVNDRWIGNTLAFPSRIGEETAPSYTPPPYSLYFIRKPFTASSHQPTKHSKGKGKVKEAAPVYSSPRIGLDLSHPGTTSPTVRPLHSRIVFLPRPYRYFREPHLLVANGRPHTFVGIVHHCAQSLLGEATSRKTPLLTNVVSWSRTPVPGIHALATASPQRYAQELTKALSSARLLANVCRITGLREVTAEKYLEHYNRGRKGGQKTLEMFIGADGKGAGSTPMLYLSMMGAISTMDMDS